MVTGCLTFNNYFYLFLYLYITRITINSKAPHLKSPKNQNKRAALGGPAMKLPGWGWLKLVCGRPTLTLDSDLVHQPKQTTKTKRIKQKKKKQAAGIEGQVATMLEFYTRQKDTINTTTIKRSRKKKAKRRQNRSAALGRPALKLLGGFN